MLLPCCIYRLIQSFFLTTVWWKKRPVKTPMVSLWTRLNWKLCAKSMHISATMSYLGTTWTFEPAQSWNFKKLKVYQTQHHFCLFYWNNNFVRSHFFTNEPLTSWTLFSSIWGTLQYTGTPNLEKSVQLGRSLFLKKCFFYKIHTLMHTVMWSSRCWCKNYVFLSRVTK